jgi:hypothetical protein
MSAGILPALMTAGFQPEKKHRRLLAGKGQSKICLELVPKKKQH